MPLTKGKTDEITGLDVLRPLGVIVTEGLDSQLEKISKTADSPLALYATFPTADSKLNIGVSLVAQGDGTAKVSPIQDDLVADGFVATTIDFQTGTVVGGTVKTDKSTFALPTGSTTGYFRRVVFAFQSDGTIDTHFSSEVAALGSLPNAGLLFAVLDGSPIGYMDIEATASAAYKTAGSATAIIENAVSSVARILKFGSGSGTGAGGDSSFKLQSISGSVVTVKKGKWTQYNRIFISGNVTSDNPLDITIDLATLLATPVASTTYWLCIDTYASFTPVELSDTHQTVIPVYATTHFAVVASTYADLWKWRYIPVGSIRTPGTATWTGSTIKTIPPRIWNSPLISVSPTLISSVKQSIGTVGAASQIRAGHVLGTKSFPAAALDTAKLSFYNLGADTNDEYGSRNLTPYVTSPAYTKVNILGEANKAIYFNSTICLESTNAFFNPGNVNFFFAAWFALTDWTPSGGYATMTLVTNSQDATHLGYRLYVSPDGSINLDYPITASTNGTLTIPNPGFVDITEWHHIAVRYTSSTTKWEIFIDGVNSGLSAIQTNLTVASNIFRFGALYGYANYMDGRAEELVFANNVALSDEDIKKIYSYRYDHLKNMFPEKQSWSFNLWRGAETFASPLATKDIMVDMSDPDSCFWDMTGMGTTDKVDICLQNKGADGSSAVPVSQYARIITATGVITATGTNLPTYLPELPKSMQAWQYDGTYWQPKDLVGMLKISNAYPWYVQGDIDAWTPSVANPVMIVIATLGMAVAVANADTTQAGVLPHVNYEKRQVVTGAMTAAVDGIYLVNTTAGAFQIDLPLAPVAGDKVTFMDAKKTFNTNNLTVGRNGQNINGAAANYPCNSNGDKVEFVYIDVTYGWSTFTLGV